MNKQLLELLATQAGMDVYKMRMYPGGFPREDFLVLDDFADLILFECIKLAVFRGDAATAKAIKEHFGVE